MKKRLTLLLFSLILVFSACNPNPEPDPVTPDTPSSLKGHHVICGYYPIEPRWKDKTGKMLNGLFIGNQDYSIPLLRDREQKSLFYANRPPITEDDYSDDPKDYDKVLIFDFEAMRNAGVDVVNVHIIDTDLAHNMSEEQLLSAIDSAATTVGISWTPTYDAPHGIAAHPIEVIAKRTRKVLDDFRAGKYKSLFIHDKKPVFFWHLNSENGTPDISYQLLNSIIETSNLTRKDVNIILDRENFDPTVSQNNQATLHIPVEKLAVYKNTIRGFYSWSASNWVRLHNKKDIINAVVNRCESHGYIPVLSVIPAFDDVDIGQSLATQQGNPLLYNETMDAEIWRNDLNIILENSSPKSWLYIQAYDEWGESSAIAPSIAPKSQDFRNPFAFLKVLKEQLTKHGWINGSSEYIYPEVPNRYKRVATTTDIPVSTIVKTTVGKQLKLNVKVEHQDIPSSLIKMGWEQQADVNFADINNPVTDVTFAKPGLYTLKFTAAFDNQLAFKEKVLHNYNDSVEIKVRVGLSDNIIIPMTYEADGHITQEWPKANVTRFYNNNDTDKYADGYGWAFRQYFSGNEGYAGNGSCLYSLNDYNNYINKLEASGTQYLIPENSPSFDSSYFSLKGNKDGDDRLSRGYVFPYGPNNKVLEFVSWWGYEKSKAGDNYKVKFDYSRNLNIHTLTVTSSVISADIGPMTDTIYKLHVTSPIPVTFQVNNAANLTLKNPGDTANIEHTTVAGQKGYKFTTQVKF